MCENGMIQSHQHASTCIWVATYHRGRKRTIPAYYDQRGGELRQTALYSNARFFLLLLFECWVVKKENETISAALYSALQVCCAAFRQYILEFWDNEKEINGKKKKSSYGAVPTRSVGVSRDERA